MLKALRSSCRINIKNVQRNQKAGIRVNAQKRSSRSLAMSSAPLTLNIRFP
jgi:hypothetical protein